MAENPGALKAMKGWRWSTPFHRHGAGDTAGKSGSVGAIPEVMPERQAQFGAHAVEIVE